MGIIEKIFGTHSHNELKRIYPIVDRIEALAPAMEALSDEELKGKTKEFKDRLNEGETLDDILPDGRLEKIQFLRHPNVYIEISVIHTF